jgi:DNA-binding CsgD family transcriptional regulator
VSLESVLDALSMPAFVLNRRGAIRHGNPAAMALLAQDRTGTSALLRSAVHRGGCHGLEVAPLVGPGQGQLFLATCLRAPGMKNHVQEAARRWSLTTRQREVLQRLVCGSSNAGIALDLGCSVKTVEAHISAIFEKVQVDRRSALVARVLGAHDS